MSKTYCLLMISPQPITLQPSFRIKAELLRNACNSENLQAVPGGTTAETQFDPSSEESAEEESAIFSHGILLQQLAKFSARSEYRIE